MRAEADGGSAEEEDDYEDEGGPGLLTERGETARRQNRGLWIATRS
jgi:hypothetical protein